MNYSVQSDTFLKTDSFRAGRIAALQPHLNIEALSQPMMRTADPLILINMANVIRMWGHNREDLPHDFCELVEIRSVSRQPIAIVVVEAEHIRRELNSTEEPFAGTSYDATSWETNDLFELKPLEPLSFPRQEAVDESPLKGQEELRSCDACAGVGQRGCVNCGATGQVLCPSCGGTLQLICQTCGGAGRHIGMRGNYIQCQTCRTRGYVRCNQCNRGHLPCDTCSSSGHITCDFCLGHGNLIRRWRLTTRTTIWHSYSPYLSVDWRLPTEALVEDCQEIKSISWSGIQPPVLRDHIPDHLIVLADRQIAEFGGRANSLNANVEQISGMRLRILGAYVYKVEWQCDQAIESVYLGGLSSRAFTHRGAAKTGTFRGFFRSLAKRLSRPFDKPLVERAYLHSVRIGEVHVSDTRCLIPEAARHAQSQIEVTGDGYTVIVPARSSNAAESQSQPVQITWDVDDSGQLVLCTTVLLGFSSRRDKFAELLGLTQQLSFGRLAFHRDPRVQRVQIVLTDRRLYDTLRASEFGRILVAMASEACELQRQEAFS